MPDTNWLLEKLSNDGPIVSSDRQLSLSKYLIRCPKKRLAAIGGERPEKEQINAFLDTLHWRKHELGGQGRVVLVVGRGKHTIRVLHAIATMNSSLNPNVDIEVQVDFKPDKLSPPDFSNSSEKCEEWLASLQGREEMELPELASSLQEKVDRRSFRWYRTVTSDSWSGRVEGLEVCSIKCGATSGVLEIGKPGRGGAESPPRIRFHELIGEASIEFQQDELDKIAGYICKLDNDRRGGRLASYDLEHLLESRILRGNLAVELPEYGRLEPTESRYPFQFPALWSPQGRAKYIDALMRQNSIPWVLELKVATGGQGKYYRHAIAQVVLYREFIRGATGFHPWFKERKLDPCKIEAAVVFPEIRGPRAQELREHVSFLAQLFGVHVVELPADWHVGRTVS